MANTSLISAPSTVDQDALKAAIHQEIEKHKDSGSDVQAVANSMSIIKTQIQEGNFGPPAPPQSKFDVSFLVGVVPGVGPDFSVAFTWHW